MPEPLEVIVSIKFSTADISAYFSGLIVALALISSSSSSWELTSSSDIPATALLIFRYADRSSGEASKWRIIDIETTLSSPRSFIPLTPVDFLPLKTLTAVVENRIALPLSVTSITSSSSLAILALTNLVSSGKSIAIFPFDLTFVKSDRAFLLTSPDEVEKII